MQVSAQISVGELIDKLTILEIKSLRIEDSTKLSNVKKEIEVLKSATDGIPSNPELNRLKAELRDINEKLWDVEDRLRECERKSDFGQKFIADARLVYLTNDRRAEVKRRINELMGSALIEEKSYRPYK